MHKSVVGIKDLQNMIMAEDLQNLMEIKLGEHNMKKRLIILTIIILSAVQCALAGFVLASNNLQINEIAWMGTASSSYDEWIELKNNSSEAIDLTGWKIIARDGIPIINLTGSVVSGGFYLLERTTTDGVRLSVTADLMYSGNSISNTGEFLELFDSGGVVVHAVDASAGWMADEC